MDGQLVAQTRSNDLLGRIGIGDVHRLHFLNWELLCKGNLSDMIYFANGKESGRFRGARSIQACEASERTGARELHAQFLRAPPGISRSPRLRHQPHFRPNRSHGSGPDHVGTSGGSFRPPAPLNPARAADGGPPAATLRGFTLRTGFLAFLE
jgi:hypothetical protein